MIILITLFVIGVILVVIGVLMICFPRALDELSNFTSQVIINIENRVTRNRLPFGILVFLLGVLLMWIALTVKL